MLPARWAVVWEVLFRRQLIRLLTCERYHVLHCNQD
jgi:hypothetical protein